ncbi:O-Antigen ligase [Pseudobythopirellula maris]|uniref:O-Antigen ligase n=1 Tax=Pseudobythopirellula maris TaxID=2527991 RepID=A0A5C5ZRS2_9BACT|nr:O-antigen ligase family protein [Pseudobythopirellula maris]TWT90242.1 O-Antigen ligase [Pseudobythopirellula maris]
MDNARSHPPDESTNKLRDWLVVGGTALMLFVVFWNVEHDPRFAGSQIAGQDEEEIIEGFVDGIDQGSLARQLGLVGFAAFGLVGLYRTRSRPLVINLASVSLMLFGLWVVSSVAWSSSPGLSLKRATAYGFLALGMLGMSRVLRPGQLLVALLMALTAFTSVSMLLDLANGAGPWIRDYRFSGTLHPNMQAMYCGVACLAAYCLMASGRRTLGRGLFAGLFVLMFLTQSRTCLLALALAMVAVFLLRLNARTRWIASMSLVCLLGMAMFVIGSLNTAQVSKARTAALLGRTEKASTLSGRVPLWEELMNDVRRSPMLGYGYEAYWTPEQIEELSQSQQWAMQSAHNAYLEVTLALGLVGLSLLLAAVVLHLFKAQQAYDATREPFYAFVYGVLVFALVTGLLESLFVRMSLPSGIAMLGMCSVGLGAPLAADKQAAREPADYGRLAWGGAA